MGRRVGKEVVRSYARRQLAAVRAEMREIEHTTRDIAAGVIQQWYRTIVSNRVPDQVRQEIIAAVYAERAQIEWAKVCERGHRRSFAELCLVV